MENIRKYINGCSSPPENDGCTNNRHILRSKKYEQSEKEKKIIERKHRPRKYEKPTGGTRPKHRMRNRKKKKKND